MATDSPEAARSPPAHASVTASLQARVEALQTGLAKLETTTASHRAGIERAERLMAGLLKAEQAAARRPRSWWRRLVGWGKSAAKPQRVT
jgi:exonuclease VII small subunit